MAKIKYRIIDCPHCKERIFEDTEFCFWCGGEVPLSLETQRRYGDKNPVKEIELDDMPESVKNKQYSKEIDYIHFDKYLPLIIFGCLFMLVVTKGIFIIFLIIGFAVYGFSQQSEYTHYHVAGDNCYREMINRMLKRQAVYGERYAQEGKLKRNRLGLQLEFRELREVISKLEVKWNEERQEYEGIYRPPMCYDERIGDPLYYSDWKASYYYLNEPFILPENMYSGLCTYLSGRPIISKLEFVTVTDGLNFYDFLKAEATEEEYKQISKAIHEWQRLFLPVYGDYTTGENTHYIQIYQRVYENGEWNSKLVNYIDVSNLLEKYSDFLNQHPRRKRTVNGLH